METIVVGIMHYIKATFHVDLMYGSEVMNQNLSKSGGFLIFFSRKGPIILLQIKILKICKHNTDVMKPFMCQN